MDAWRGRGRREERGKKRERGRAGQLSIEGAGDERVLIDDVVESVDIRNL